MRGLHYSAGMTSMYDEHARHTCVKYVYTIVHVCRACMTNNAYVEHARHTCATYMYHEHLWVELMGGYGRVLCHGYDIMLTSFKIIAWDQDNIYP